MSSVTMKRRTAWRLFSAGLAFCLVFCLASCSTTRKLSEGEVLYVGVKKIKVELPEKVKLNGKQSAAVSGPLSVKPNNSLYTPYIRSPFALGLWVYNWDIRKEKGLKWWLYRKLSVKPVLLSDVKPELCLKMVENNMKDFGFFGTRTSYEIIPRKHNPKKARISYRSLSATGISACGGGLRQWIPLCALRWSSPN